MPPTKGLLVSNIGPCQPQNRALNFRVLCLQSRPLVCRRMAAEPIRAEGVNSQRLHLVSGKIIAVCCFQDSMRASTSSSIPTAAYRWLRRVASAARWSPIFSRPPQKTA